MRDQLATPERDIYSISRLNEEVSRLLNGGFPLLWIEGEISNFSQPRSGHMYFSLKDAAAQVRAAMFRNNNLFLRFKPEAGMQVLVRARVSLYEPRGDYQLIVEHMEEAGDGALRRAFEHIKQTLQAEGLFAAENKRPLPEFPHRLGIITSPSGAAIRDVLSVLKRRYPRLPILIYPVAVQGDSAAREIVQALRLANLRADCDVLLLTRGGGSLEDLQAFNDESVARAMAASSIPVISGIGHEIDYTIADFAADLRAPTPSAAAELISPDTAQLQQQLTQRHSALQRVMERWLAERIETIRLLQQRLQRLHPQQKLNSQNQRLDELETRLRRSVVLILQQTSNRLAHSQAILYAHNPIYRIRQSMSDAAQFQHRLQRALQSLLQKKQHIMNSLLRNLDTVSPLNTLRRGYAIVTQSNAERPLVSSNNIVVGEKLHVRLAEGELRVKVEKNKPLTEGLYFYDGDT